MSLPAIANFEILHNDQEAVRKIMISFHDEDAPHWLKDSQLHRHWVDGAQGLLIVEGVGPRGQFQLPFGPMTAAVAQSLNQVTDWIFLALGEKEPAYALELKA